MPEPGPETRFQPAGISYNTYSPVRTDLAPPIQLPGTGALWANVGKTAMDAAAQLQNTPLINPAIRAGMQNQIANYQQNEWQMQQIRNLPGNEGAYLGRATPTGYEGISPAEVTNPTAALQLMKAFGLQQKPNPNAPAAPATPKAAPGTGSEPQEQTSSPQTPYGGLEEKSTAPTQPKIDAEHPPATIQDLSANKPTGIFARTGLAQNAPSYNAFQGPNQGQTNAAVQEAIARNQFASSGSGIPSNYQPPSQPQIFLNPATGSYEPLQQQPPPQQPPQPTQEQVAQQQAAQQAAQKQQQEAQERAQLTQWQQQNAQPPAGAPEALAWAKRLHTGYTDATYLATGGPGGTPAFNFTTKNGASNIVPLSQMIKNGFGPTVAAQNTSTVLSKVEQMNAPQGPTGPGLPFGPVSPATQGQPGQPAAQPPAGIAQTGPVAPPVSGGQPTGGPPPAPTAPYIPSPGALGAARAQAAQFAATGGPPPAGQQPYPQIASDQGGTQGQPGTSYDTGLIRQQLAEYAQNPQNLTAQTAQAGTPAVKPETVPLSDSERADLGDPDKVAAARANAKVNPNLPANAANSDGSGGDPYMGDLGPYHLYRDDRNRTGELYAIRPGLTTLFKQQRYMLGSDGWQEYELPNTNMRLNMEAEYGGGKGGVGGHGNFPIFNHDQLASMSVPAMTQWLKLAGDYHNTNGEPNSTMEQRLTNLADTSQRIQRLIDGVTAAQGGGKDATQYNRKAQDWSHNAAARDQDVPPGGWTPWNKFYGPDEEWNRVMSMWHNMWAHGTPVNRFSDYLEEQVKRMNDSMTQTPGRQEALQNQQQKEGPSLTVYGPYGTGATIKSGTSQESVSPHREINRVFESGDQNEAVEGLKQLKAEYDRQFEESYEDARTHNFRLNPQSVYNHNALSHGIPMEDKGNIFRNADGHVIDPYPPPARPPNVAAPRPVIKSDAELDAFQKAHPGAPFDVPDGKGGLITHQ